MLWRSYFKLSQRPNAMKSSGAISRVNIELQSSVSRALSVSIIRVNVDAYGENVKYMYWFWASTVKVCYSHSVKAQGFVTLGTSGQLDLSS
jgi:hypothetical protein